jgi:hypothetical protein
MISVQLTPNPREENNEMSTVVGLSLDKLTNKIYRKKHSGSPRNTIYITIILHIYMFLK